MVSVSFCEGEVELARLNVTSGAPISGSGDLSWLDLSVAPHSVRLGRTVSFEEDGEEWARSLPSTYASPALSATVIVDDHAASADDPDLALGGGVCAPSVTAPQVTGGRRWRLPAALLIMPAVAVALIAIFFAPPSSKPNAGYPPAFTSGFLRNCNSGADASLLGQLSPDEIVPAQAAVGSFCVCILNRIKAQVPARQFERDALAFAQGTGSVPSYLLGAERACLPGLNFQLQQLQGAPSGSIV